MKLSVYICRFSKAALGFCLAAALLCGCGAQSAQGSQSSQSAAGGSAAASSAQSTETKAETGSSSAVYDSSVLNDGTLRLLDGYNLNTGSSASTVLCGDKVLCKGNSGDTLQLVYDDVSGEAAYYMRAWADTSSASGRVTALYDKSGAEVMRFDKQMSLTLTGDILTADSSEAYSAVEFGYISDVGSLRVFDLSTGAELPVPENAVSCAAAGDFLARVFNYFSSKIIFGLICRNNEVFINRILCRILFHGLNLLVQNSRISNYKSSLPNN